jgi:hypothetical protein
MAKSKYDKNFIFKGQPSPLHPEGTYPWVPLMRIDSRFMKGAPYFECIWQIGPMPADKAYKPHCHDWDEYVGFFGSNPDDPSNLNAEIQFWLDGEKHILTKNCLILVPAGVWHGPIVVEKLTKPIFCLSASTALEYSQKINHDPKWAHLKDPPEGNYPAK